MSDPFDIFIDNNEQAAAESVDSFGGDESYDSRPTVNNNSNNSSNKFNADVYKKWYRSKSASGFMSVNHWLDVGKISFDIGQLDGNSSSATKVFVDAIAIAAWLRDKVTGANFLPENFDNYGGSNSGGNPISKIFKVAPNENRPGYIFRSGHFKASVNDQGAFIPKMSEPISTNSINMSPTDVAQLSYRIELLLNNFVSNTTQDVFRKLNGERD